MKKLKKLLCTVLSLVLIASFSIVGVSADSAITDMELTCTVSGSVATITGYTGSSTDVTIPETITDGTDTYTVTAIGSGLNLSNTTVKKLHIPKTVTTFGDNVIDTSAPPTIYVPDSDTEKIVRANIVKNAEAVDGVVTGGVYINAMVVYNEYVSDPRKWKTSEDKVSSYTGTDTKVAVATHTWDGKEMTGISGLSDERSDTTQPIELLLPNTIETQPAKDFINSSTTGLLPIKKLVVNFDVSQNNLFRCNTNMEEAVINGAITANYIFEGCSALKKVTVSDVGDVENIFHNTSSLEEITFNGTLEHPSEKTILNTTVSTLKKVIIGKNGNIKTTDSNLKVFNNIKSTVTDMEIYGKVSANNAFINFTVLKNVHIYKSADLIASQIFWKCTALENVTFEEGATIASGSCFRDCTGLEEVTVAKNVKFTGWAPFNACSNLKKITLKQGSGSSDTLLYATPKLKTIMIPEGTDVSVNLFNSTKDTSLPTNATAYFPEGTNLSISNNTASGKRIAKFCLFDDGTSFTDETVSYGSETFLKAKKINYISLGYWYTSGDENFEYTESCGAETIRPKFVLPIAGDANANGEFDITDLVRYKEAIESEGADAPYICAPLADFDAVSGAVDDSDMQLAKKLLLGDTSVANELNTYLQTLVATE